MRMGIGMGISMGMGMDGSVDHCRKVNCFWIDLEWR